MSTSLSQTHLRVFGVICIAGFGLAACGTGRSASGSSPRPARAIFGLAIAAAEVKGSLQVVQASSDSPGASNVYNIGQSEGKETTSSPGANGTILVLPGIAYVMGDAGYLEGNGFPQAAASLYDGRWVSFHPADPGYSQIVDGLTLGSALSYGTPSGALRRNGTTTVEGQAVVAISGGISAPLAPPGATGSETIYISEVEPYLPVEIVARVMSSGRNVTITSMLSHWGEPLSYAAPSSSTPVSAILSPTGRQTA